MSCRIAMVGACPYPVPQGSQVFLRENALAVQSRGHEVHLVVYGHGLGCDDNGLIIHRCGRVPGDTRTAAGPSLVKPLLDISMICTLRRVIRQEKIGLVFAHNYEALMIALAAGKRPIIYHAHNAMADELPHYFSRGKAPAEWFGRWLDRTFPRRADRMLAPHRRLAGHLIVRGCDHQRVRIVPPPLAVEAFEPCVPAREIPPILYAGNLDAYQNLELLHAAMERVRAKVPAARLVIATADPLDAPGVEIMPIHGFDSLQRVLAQDSVFAVPRVSWSGYPIKMLNAMAAGKAIVACQSTAYPLTHDIDGLIVPDNDPSAFAEALLRLMHDHKLRAELGRNARETVAREHDPARVAEQLDAVIDELIGNESSPA